MQAGLPDYMNKSLLQCPMTYTKNSGCPTGLALYMD